MGRVEKWKLGVSSNTSWLCTEVGYDEMDAGGEKVSGGIPESKLLFRMVD